MYTLSHGATWGDTRSPTEKWIIFLHKNARMSQCLLPGETTLICKTGLQPGNCWYSGASRSSVGSGFLRDARLGSCPGQFLATKGLQGTGVGWELSPLVAASPGDIPWPCWGQCHHQAPPPAPAASLPSVRQERAQHWLRLAVLASHTARPSKTFAAPLSTRQRLFSFTEHFLNNGVLQQRLIHPTAGCD